MNLNNLGLETNILEKLKLNKIDSIEKLWKLNKKELKELKFTYEEINLIAVKLQLKGLDLNKRKTK